MLAEFLKFCNGMVKLRVRSAYPERLLNLCSFHGVRIYEAVRADVDLIYITVPFRDLKKIRSFVRKAHGRIWVVHRFGLPFWLGRTRYRYGLWGGAAFFIVLLYILFTRIWAIDISAPPGISEREVAEQLETLGVRCGVAADNIDVKKIQTQMMLERQDLSFIAINLNGNQAKVQIEARTPKPEILDEDLITSVVAKKTGIITEMEVKGGTAVKKVGETVMQGEMLIDALTQPVKEESQPFLSHAFGEVEARTWERIRSVRCLKTEEKVYTGEKKTRYAVVLGKKRINLYLDSGTDGASCDKITEEKKIVLGDGYTLPVYLVQQELVYYETKSAEFTAKDLQSEMEQAAKMEIQNRIDGKIVNASNTFSEENGLAILTTVSECREQIGEVIADTRTPEDIKKAEEEKKKGSE